MKQTIRTKRIQEFMQKYANLYHFYEHKIRTFNVTDQKPTVDQAIFVKDLKNEQQMVRSFIDDLCQTFEMPNPLEKEDADDR